MEVTIVANTAAAANKAKRSGPSQLSQMAQKLGLDALRQQSSQSSPSDENDRELKQTRSPFDWWEKNDNRNRNSTPDDDLFGPSPEINQSKLSRLQNSNSGETDIDGELILVKETAKTLCGGFPFTFTLTVSVPDGAPQDGSPNDVITPIVTEVEKEFKILLQDIMQRHSQNVQRFEGAFNGDDGGGGGDDDGGDGDRHGDSNGNGGVGGDDDDDDVDDDDGENEGNEDNGNYTGGGGDGSGRQGGAELDDKIDDQREARKHDDECSTRGAGSLNNDTRSSSSNSSSTNQATSNRTGKLAACNLSLVVNQFYTSPVVSTGKNLLNGSSLSEVSTSKTRDHCQKRTLTTSNNIIPSDEKKVKFNDETSSLISSQDLKPSTFVPVFSGSQANMPEWFTNVVEDDVIILATCTVRTAKLDLLSQTQKSVKAHLGNDTNENTVDREVLLQLRYIALTDKEEKSVREIQQKEDGSELVIEKFNTPMRVIDLRTLKTPKWLNDQVRQLICYFQEIHTQVILMSFIYETIGD